MVRVNRELLPIGKKINHDGSSLEIVKRLKAGLTGEVYEGNLFLNDKEPVHVAVKAMKTLEFPAARQFFLQESETLAFLMHLEEEANREQGLDLKVAPIYYGRGEYQENPYLVMEFIEGKEIPDLLKDLDGGKFREKQTLTIVWHLYRTLDVLHRLLRKTYIDLKFENLWWVNGSEQLKLTDFGTLEEIQSADMQRRGVLRDLLLAAVYFCKMATGYMPNYSLGELKEFGELKKNVQNANISWGAKRELKRLLHRNPAQRPVDASDVSARLRTLVDFWSRDEDKVLEIARKSLDRAQTAYDDANAHKKPISEEGLNSAYRARSAFEIVSLRSPDVDIAYDNERLDVILRSADHLERGKNLLRGRSYTLAKQVFQEGMEWGEDSATLRRWAYLAEIGEAISPTDFEAIQDQAFIMLDDSFSQEVWKETLNQLEKIQSVLKAHQRDIPVGLSSLFSEVRLFAEIEQADKSFENDDFTDAANHYRFAHTYLEELPDFYRKFIRDTELGDLEKNAREMDAKILRVEQEEIIDGDYDQSIECAKKGKNKESLILAEKAYRASCAISHHSERLEEVIFTALEKQNYKLAFDSAQIVLLCGEVSPELIVDLALTNKFYKANQSLEIPDPIQFYENIFWALENSESYPFAGDCIRDLLDKAEKKAKGEEDADLYMRVGELREKIGDAEHASDLKSKAEKIYKKKFTERHAKVDDLIAEANILGVFNPDPFDNATSEKWISYSISETVRILRTPEERFKYAEDILARAEILARIDDYHLGDIADGKTNLTNMRERSSVAVLELSKAYKEKYEDNLFGLNLWWGKIASLLDWRKRSWDAFGDSKASRIIYEELYAETSDFLTACYAVLQGEEHRTLIDRQNENFAELMSGIDSVATTGGVEIQVLIESAQKVLYSLGPDAWSGLKQKSEFVISKTESLLADSNNAFENGDLPLAQSLLDQAKPSAGETLAWRNLHTKTMRVVLWRKWQEDNFEKFNSSEYYPDILNSIRNYAEHKLPLGYWSGTVAEAYLKKMEGVLQSKVVGENERYKDADFIDTLKKRLDVSWTNRLVLFPGMGRLGWDAEKWLNSAYSSIAKNDIVALTELIHEAPIPEQIDSALIGINSNAWTTLIALREVNAHMLSEENRKKGLKKVMIFSAVVLVFCGVLALAAFLNREGIGQLISGTYTPTATLTPTATPTFMSTPTLPSTPTLIPTPLTPSIYLVPDPKVIYPVIPDAVESAWVIPPESVTAEPAISDTTIWRKEISTDPESKNEVFYSTQKAVLLYWTTDQPLPEGWYAIYVLDTKSKSGGYGPQTYTISSNGQNLLPFRGQSSVLFNVEELGQKSDEWLALGVYEIQAGEKIEVKTVIPLLTGSARFGLSKLLIVKITDPQKALYDLLPSERVLFSLSDDISAAVLDSEKMALLNIDYQGKNSDDPNAWGGIFRKLEVDLLNGISNKVSVKWQFAGRLPEGKYQLMVWIPANSSVVGEFSMLLNGKPVDKQSLPIINQADHPGQWWVVDIWNLSEEGSVSVIFTVDAKENSGKIIGIDAVALIKVE